MTIQFLCPSCRHPIEIDDEWASQSVACPFCRKTVTAPAESTYHPPSVAPEARAVADGMPADLDGAVLETPSNRLAVVALGLAVAHLLSFFVTSAIAGAHIVEAVGEDATPAEVQRYMQGEVERGVPPDWMIPVTLMMLLCLALWVGGLICAILGVQNPFRRRLALGAFAVLSITPLLVCMSFVQILG